MTKQIAILGTRGIPANHGGFETFAEELALYLVAHGWKVTVYCQEDGGGKIYRDKYEDVDLIKIPIQFEGAKGTILFDYKATLLAAKEKIPVLLLGYNTAVFNMLLKVRGVPVVTNMDGLEYYRSKWSSSAKLWFRINERFAIWFSDHLIADHPEIENHLLNFSEKRKITMIPYGANELKNNSLDLLVDYHLKPRSYAILIARPEPENKILEIVKAFSKVERGYRLIVLGKYNENNSYQKEVLNSASEEVLFLGPIYDKEIVSSLRYHAKYYFHGHSVGGTNPSLVEAMGAGNPVVANDNRFNRWVCGQGAIYFNHIDDCHEAILKMSDENLRKEMSNKIIDRFRHEFRWECVLDAYQRLLERIFKVKEN